MKYFPIITGYISTGVPRDSVLGPTLFILFINNFDNINPESMFAAFTDDVSALTSDKSDVIPENNCFDLDIN